MSEARFRLTEQRLTTPRSAAIAGFLFALLQTTSQVLILIWNHRQISKDALEPSLPA